MIDRGYKILNESLKSKLGIASLAGMIASFGMWILNRNIRTNKILSTYPDPMSLKAKLEANPNITVRAVGAELNPTMSPELYRLWVQEKVNPKMNLGRAIFLTLFPISLPVEVGRGIINKVERTPDSVFDRAVKTKRIYY